MHEPLYDKKILKERGLVTNGYCLSYNPKLTARAKELRKNMTQIKKRNEIPEGYKPYYAAVLGYKNEIITDAP